MDETTKAKRKTHTSTAVKARYNAKTYTRLVLDVRKETAAAFKARCAELGISYSAILHKAIADTLETAKNNTQKGDVMKKYEVNYLGGESRYEAKAVDYMLCKIDDETELYAEMENPTWDEKIEWYTDENATYEELKAEILRQAEEKGIDKNSLFFFHDSDRADILREMRIKSETIVKYLLIERSKGLEEVTPFDTLDEANEAAADAWRQLAETEKKDKQRHIFVGCAENTKDYYGQEALESDDFDWSGFHSLGAVKNGFDSNALA